MYLVYCVNWGRSPAKAAPWGILFMVIPSILFYASGLNVADYLFSLTAGFLGLVIVGLNEGISRRPLWKSAVGHALFLVFFYALMRLPSGPCEPPSPFRIYD